MFCCNQTTHRHPRNAPNIPYRTFIIIDNDNGTTSILLPLLRMVKNPPQDDTTILMQ
jgi:hypothetical protein